MKWCPACEEFVPIDEFFRNRTRPDGHDAHCKACRTAKWSTPEIRARRAAATRLRRQDPEVRERHAAAQRRARAANPEIGRRAGRQRRARLRQVPSEPYATLEIARRDGWRCQLCDELIDPALQWPDPRSLSIDHVVPLSRGGPDIRVNVQAAHLLCNQRKHASAA